MSANVVGLPIVPRRLSHDITDTDFAARLRQGLVARTEIEERAFKDAFLDWMKWKGTDVWKASVARDVSNSGPAGGCDEAVRASQAPSDT